MRLLLQIIKQMYKYNQIKENELVPCDKIKNNLTENQAFMFFYKKIVAY